MISYLSGRTAGGSRQRGHASNHLHHDPVENLHHGPVENLHLGGDDHDEDPDHDITDDGGDDCKQEKYVDKKENSIKNEKADDKLR